MTGLLEPLFKLNRIRRTRQYHLNSNKAAARKLGLVEKQRGPLSAEVKKKCDDYAVSVLNDICYAPWLYFYSAVRGGFHEGWIPSNYWGRVVVPKIQGEHGRVSGIKSMNYLMVGSDTFPDLLSYANSTFFTPTGNMVQAAHVKDALFSSGDRIIFKPDNSLQGKGIKIFDKDTFDREALLGFGSGVFQRFIDQEESLASFFPLAVSTLRLNTVINERGNAELRSANLRFGTGVDKHVSSASQIRVPVCLRTGLLNDAGFTYQWAEVSKHPDSKKKFSGFEYPMFKEAVETVSRLHERMPFIKCIGWDAVLDNTGKINIMEWNGRQNDIQFPEATQGPCYTGLGW
ncbi:sugar-transfer associated ATP-grasp domain-containing protein [Shimia sp. W99]